MDIFMTGRMENEEKINSAIMANLEDMPVYVHEWHEYLRASNSTAASRRDLLYKLRRFLSFINPDISAIRIWDITSDAVAKYFMIIQTKSVKQGADSVSFEYTSAAYKQSIWSCLNNFFSFMKRKHYIQENYMEYIQRPKNNDRERLNSTRLLLTKEDFNRILQTVADGVGSDKAKSYQHRFYSRDLSIMLLFMTTGMRRTALSEINVSDIDFCERTITVIDKGDVKHIYFLGEKVFSAIGKWMEERAFILKNRPETDALFITGVGNRMLGSSIYAMIGKYCEGALGYHVSPHKLRSGFCSIMFEETGNIEFVRRAVGHADVSTTQRYIVTKNDERERAAKIMNNILDVHKDGESQN